MKRKSPSSLARATVANIKALRISRRWTQTELGERLVELWPLGMDSMRTVIQRVESGQRDITIDELAVFAAVFGVEPWSLTAPSTCDTCIGSPPAGFTCNDCGRAG